MRRTRRRSRNQAGCLLLSVIFCCAAGMPATAEDFLRVPADQIKPLMSGTTIERKSAKGDPMLWTFRPDGSLKGVVRPQGEDKKYDEGKWSVISSGILCFEWKRWNKGKRLCRALSANKARLQVAHPRTGEIKQIWQIKDGGSRTAQIIAALRSDGSQGAALPVAGRATLNGSQLRMLFAGTTIETVSSSSGKPLFFTFEPGGALRGRLEAEGGAITDDGKWWIVKDRMLCWQFSRFAGAKRRCPLVNVDGSEVELFNSRSGERLSNLPKWKIKTAGPQVAALAGPGAAGRPPAPSLPRPPRTAPDRDPPTIDAPEQVSATGAVAEFVGRIRDASRLVEVTIDARPVTIEGDGTVRISRGVPQGRSTIVIAALDEWGNRASRRVTVNREVLVATAPITPLEKIPARAETFSDIHFGRYHALVIGNNKYRKLNRLETAEIDAKAVAQLLKDSYGFKVTVLLNATRADMIGALTKLRAKLTSEDNLLIYYAGHGELDTIAEQGYWLPVDAEADVPTNWVSTSDITTMVRAIRAKHIMVVADSCYSGTLVRASQTDIKTARARRAWLTRMSKKRARTAMVSGGLEPVLDGGGAGHSVFAKAFLDALTENKGVLDGQALFDVIKRPVVVNADQTPQYSDIRRAGHDGGDFIFVRR